MNSLVGVLSLLVFAWLVSSNRSRINWRTVGWAFTLQATIGGVALFSTLLDGSLHELKQAWQAVDQRPHVNRFLTQAQVADAIKRAGFNPQGLSMETVVMTYQHPLALLKDLKGIGANYVVGAKRRASTPAQLNKMIQIYQRDYSLANQPAAVSATYQLGYGVLIND